MSLIQGGLSLARHLVLGPVPSEKELLGGLVQDCFRPFEDGLEEERVGWCDWRRLKITPPDPSFVMNERNAVFSLRIDTRKVPADLLRAEVEERIEQLAKEKDLAFVSKECRISIQDEVKADLLRKVLASPKTYEVVWDLKGGQLFTTATSTKPQGILIGLFIKSFGCELQPLGPLLLAGAVAPDLPVASLMALDPFDMTIRDEANL